MTMNNLLELHFRFVDQAQSLHKNKSYTVHDCTVTAPTCISLIRYSQLLFGERKSICLCHWWTVGVCKRNLFLTFWTHKPQNVISRSNVPTLHRSLVAVHAERCRINASLFSKETGSHLIKIFTSLVFKTDVISCRTFKTLPNILLNNSV